MGSSEPRRKMNIIYGVSGEGLGHVFEAREIATRLSKEGHQVKVMTYGQRALDCLAEFAPTPIEGIHLYFNPRGMSLWDTVFKNLRIFPFYLRHGRRLIRELKAFQADVVITAYEPFSMLVAHLLRKPLISMDNQNELLHLPPGSERGGFDLKLVQLATRVCTYGAAHYIVKSFGKPVTAKDHVHFVSPIIQEEIRSLQPSIGDHILVYLTKPNPNLIAIFESMNERFRVYCNHRVGEDGNISYRERGQGYVADLGSCKAIIGTTGFSLIADSIYLRKPFFGVPLRKQFEQTHNAHFIAQAGLGECSESPSRSDLERFLANLPGYRERLSRFRLDPAEQEETLLRIVKQVAEVPAVALV
jgi:uncharacterized protein (TIGR00661 family)